MARYVISGHKYTLDTGESLYDVYTTYDNGTTGSDTVIATSPVQAEDYVYDMVYDMTPAPVSILAAKTSDSYLCAECGLAGGH